MPERPRVTVYIATSVDGFIARPDGSVDWLPQGEPDGDDMGWGEFIGSVDLLLMGRKTYDFVAAWEGEWPYPVPVVVLSRSLERVPERLSDKVRRMEGEPERVLWELHDRGHRHVYLDGGRTVQDFLAAGLVDRLILTRVPVLLGQGVPLFGPLPADIRLEHVGTRGVASGLVQSTYDVVRG